MMAKRKLKSGTMVPKRILPSERLAKALTKRTKAELVDVLVELAEDDRIMRRLESRFEMESPPEDLVAATRQAITDATDFDERQVNYNFDYDYEAYEAVKRNFGKLIEQDHLRAAMELSQELMKQGSYQVEMSDEGMMTEDIEECLQVVIKAIKKSGLPPDEVKAWCDAMHTQDRVGFICDSELRTLRDKYRSTR